MTDNAIAEADPLVHYGDVSVSEYYMGRDSLYPQELSDAHKMNAQRTVDKANALLDMFGSPRRVVSGWRPSAINAATKGAASNSKHMLCMAVDLEDNDGTLKAWCLNNQDLLKALEVWFESPEHTPTWVHMQIAPPGSGRLFFNP